MTMPPFPLRDRYVLTRGFFLLKKGTSMKPASLKFEEQLALLKQRGMIITDNAAG